LIFFRAPPRGERKEFPVRGIKKRKKNPNTKGFWKRFVYFFARLGGGGLSRFLPAEARFRRSDLQPPPHATHPRRLRAAVKKAGGSFPADGLGSFVRGARRRGKEAKREKGAILIRFSFPDKRSPCRRGPPCLNPHPLARAKSCRSAAKELRARSCFRQSA